jgi:hypothetical protein
MTTPRHDLDPAADRHPADGPPGCATDQAPSAAELLVVAVMFLGMMAYALSLFWGFLDWLRAFLQHARLW